MLRADTRQLDRLAARLDAAPARVEAALVDELRAIVTDVAIDASLYPPQPAGSDYVRTYTLERGWGVEGQGLEQAAVNATPYGPYVMGPQQAAQNRHWRTVDTIAAQWEPQAAARLVARAERELEGLL